MRSRQYRDGGMKLGDKQVNKKLIIITAAVGLVSFGGMFAFAWLTNKTAPQEAAAEQAQQSLPIVEQRQVHLDIPQSEAAATGTAVDSKLKKAMTEKQLKNLVYEVHEKTREYDDKLQSLQSREQRLQTAHNMIKDDIEELNNLRVELASIVASLKEQRDKLLQHKVQIAKSEKVNLIAIAATYDKMDASSASKILTNMCASQISSSMGDAVKILYYMSERTKAKLLAELVTSEPTLAAVLCQKLKEIIE